jgi:hypothetical protein
LSVDVCVAKRVREGISDIGWWRRNEGQNGRLTSTLRDGDGRRDNTSGAADEGNKSRNNSTRGEDRSGDEIVGGCRP